MKLFRASLPLLVCNLACSDEARIVTNAPPTEAEQPPASTEAAPVAPSPVYALETVVFTADEQTSYVSLANSLDGFDGTLDAAREFPSWTDMMAIDGALLVANAGAPTVTRYEVTDALEWRDGATLSFANQGAPWFGFSETFLMDERHAYFSPSDVTQHIVWDPTEMVILDVVEDSLLPQQDANGLSLVAAYQRVPWFYRGPVLKPFYYTDADGFTYAPTTPIVVYDPETHREERVLEAPCPGLEYSSADEAGNVYFSTWNITPAQALYAVGPAPCIAKITADRRLDETWSSAQLNEWTDGRQLGVFHYMRDGKAIGAVLHQEELGVDFTGSYDPAVAEAIATDAHWRLWLFDLEAKSARPVEGIGAVHSWFNAINLDGRTFALMTFDDVSGTRVYEIGADGTATERFESTGWVYNLVRLR